MYRLPFEPFYGALLGLALVDGVVGVVPFSGGLAMTLFNKMVCKTTSKASCMSCWTSARIKGFSFLLGVS